MENNEQKMSDGQMIEAADKMLKELMTDEERKKALANYVSKEELKATLDEALKKRDDEYGVMKTALLRAKAQGKAHIMEENPDPNEEIVKIYGQDSMVARLFRRK